MKGRMPWSIVNGHVRPGYEGRYRSDVENAAAIALEAFDEIERKFAERPHVEIDHGELLGAIKLCGPSRETEARIIDNVADFLVARRQNRREAGNGALALKVDRYHRRPLVAGRRDLSRKRIQAILSPRREHKFVSILGKDPR
jgi:hypothetical protein